MKNWKFLDNIYKHWRKLPTPKAQNLPIAFYLFAAQLFSWKEKQNIWNTESEYWHCKRRRNITFTLVCEMSHSLEGCCNISWTFWYGKISPCCCSWSKVPKISLWPVSHCVASSLSIRWIAIIPGCCWKWRNQKALGLKCFITKPANGDMSHWYESMGKFVIRKESYVLCSNPWWWMETTRMCSWIW